jgi:hypothetical protein
VRHKKFRFDHLRLNGVPVDVHYGDLLVAHDEACEHVDWEVEVTTADRLSLEHAAYDVHVETKESRQIWGPGLLVRTDGRAHVFRGGGMLDGFSPAELDG